MKSERIAPERLVTKGVEAEGAPALVYHPHYVFEQPDVGYPAQLRQAAMDLLVNSLSLGLLLRLLLRLPSLGPAPINERQRGDDRRCYDNCKRYESFSVSHNHPHVNSIIGLTDGSHGCAMTSQLLYIMPSR